MTGPRANQAPPASRRLARRLASVAIPTTVVAAVTAAVHAHPFRGYNLWSLWHVEAAERVAGAWDQGSDAIAAALGAAPQIGVLGPLLATVIRPEDASHGLEIAALFAVAVIVGATYVGARRVAGVVAGLGAVASLCAVPRFWSIATQPGATLFAVAAALSLVVGTAAARERARYSPVVLLAVVAATWAGLVPLLFVVPVVLALLWSSPGALAAPVSRRVTLPAALVLTLPAGIVVAVALLPNLRAEPVDALLAMLEFWLTKPPEPVLFAGEVYGAERLPPWGGLVILAVTTPTGLLPLGAVGLLAPWLERLERDAVPRRADAWLLGVVGVFAMMLPYLLRSQWFGGVDLIAFALPFLCVFVGVGVSVLVRFGLSTIARGGGRAWAGGAIVMAALALSASSSIAAVWRVTPLYESFYNEVVGGTSGAVERGFSRSAHAPVPVALVEDVAAAGATARAAVLSNAWEWNPIIARYQRDGVIDGTIALTTAHGADVVLVVFDDALPELYPVLPDVMQLAADVAPELQRTIERDGIPIFSAIRVR